MAHLRPYMPFIVRMFPLALRKKMVEWYPGDAMQDFVYILDTMHQTSQRIFERKKRALSGHDDATHPNDAKKEGDLGPLMQGKDIMSILRESCILPVYLLS